MQQTLMNEQIAWTEGMLAREIAGYKNCPDPFTLETFLLERLEDEDPCCISCRPRFWNEFGLMMLNQEKVDEAVDSFTKALEIEPANETALYNLATISMKENDLPAALKNYEAVLLENPDHYNALFNAGLCHLYGEDKEASLSFFMQVAALRPEDGQAQYLTGEILMQLGRAGEALPYFRLAYKENHGHFETSMGLAITLLKTGNFQETISVCDQALLVFGAATLPLQVKGDAMLALERFDEAVMCHSDLCRLDLDIRDFVVSRLRQLAEEDPASFTAYSAVVHEIFPEFESILHSALKKG